MEAASQSVVPHAQFPGLTAEPSVLVQHGMVSHWFLETSQNSPVVEASQSAVPQAQLAGLAAVPSVVVQGMKRHRSSSVKQNRKEQRVACHALGTSGRGSACTPA